MVEECHAFEWCGDTPQQRCIPLWLRNVTRLKNGAVTILESCKGTLFRKGVSLLDRGMAPRLPYSS